MLVLAFLKILLFPGLFPAFAFDTLKSTGCSQARNRVWMVSKEHHLIDAGHQITPGVAQRVELVLGAGVCHGTPGGRCGAPGAVTLGISAIAPGTVWCWPPDHARWCAAGRGGARVPAPQAKPVQT